MVGEDDTFFLKEYLYREMKLSLHMGNENVHVGDLSPTGMKQ